MYTKEQRRLLRMLNEVIEWDKSKKQSRLQKKKMIQKIHYWEKTKKRKPIHPKVPPIKPNIALQRNLPLLGESGINNKYANQMYSPKLIEKQIYDKPVENVYPSQWVEEPIHGKSLESNHYPKLVEEYTAKLNQPGSPSIDLFCFPIIDWDYRWQRPQQISRQFAQNGFRVFYFYIDSLPIEIQNATFEDIQSQIQIDEVEKNVWRVKLCSYSVLNVYRNTINHLLDLQYLKWSLEALKQGFGITHTVSIVDLPFWSTLVFELKDNKIIYDCMDEHSGFSNTSSELLALEPVLMDKADVIVTSSNHLYNKAKQLNPSVYLVPNAGDFDHFSGRAKNRPADISQVSGPIIGYIGAIADWFDMQLVYDLAIGNPHWSFVLIGCTYLSDITEIEKLNNVYFLGEKPYSELPGYIHSFDVCIIPFLINELTIATNPVKVYEYLAAGKPVISSELPELSNMTDYVKLASGAKQFEASIREALQESDGTNWIERRKHFAAENTWKKRYDSFQTIIQKRLYPKVSIIIVTHNNWELSRRCIDSVLSNSSYPRLEIVIVDNASADETPGQLLNYSQARIKPILLPENTGFAEGNIIGITNATGEYIVLLNNDTIVPEGWLSRLLRPFFIDHNIGAVGPMSNHVGNDQKLDFFIADEITGPNRIWLDEFYKLYDQRIRYTELLGFFCVAFKKEVVAHIGHLDKNYGYGMFEDDDYCLRMIEAGYRLAVAEDAFVYHQGSSVFKQWSEEKYKSLFQKNKAYFESKWKRKWKQPNLPLSLFINVYDSIKIAEIVATNGKHAILICCPKEWTDLKEEWHQKLLATCNNDQLVVIAIVSTYLSEPVHGLRKLGPNLYLTNNEQFIQHTKFDQVYSFTGGEGSGEPGGLFTSGQYQGVHGYI
ncbi:glycosyltransferase [Paenibacillus sp. sgz500958]|uniref:glycosyltransferase n=1 Tax=Paenibacillus sp. sgz500958 TaxID=3242475 RepID=UPI0036D30D8C